MESEKRLVLDEAKNVLDQYAKLILKRDKLIKKDMPEKMERNSWQMELSSISGKVIRL